MNVIESLEICAKTKNCQFTQDECRQALVLIQSLKEQIPKQDSQAEDILKWVGRWSIFFVAGIWSGFLVGTWQWVNVYYACAGACFTIFFHAGWMLREWWKK